MTELSLEVSDNPSIDDIKAIEDGLTASIPRDINPRNFKPIAVFLRDSSGKRVGGLEGSTSWGWLNVRLLWVADGLRGKGFGSELLKRAEACALERGCVRSVVDTFDFQAVNFYKKMGYKIFGVLNDYPVGHRRFYLRKDITE